MITEEKLAELRDDWVAEHSGDCHWYDDSKEMLDTLSALWRVAKAAEVMVDTLALDEDPIRDLAIAGNLRIAIKALREGKETR